MADGRIRIDKWLWHARFYKTRTQATAAVAAGVVRLNGEPCAKPAHAVAPDDVLTFVQGRVVRVVRILATGDRRGPSSEAQGLYDDLAPGVAPAPPGP